MKPHKFEYPKPSIANVIFFYKKEEKIVYRIGINITRMKATVIDGIPFIGMVPANLTSCANEKELITKMKSLGWSKS